MTFLPKKPSIMRGLSLQRPGTARLQLAGAVWTLAPVLPRNDKGSARQQPDATTTACRPFLYHRPPQRHPRPRRKATWCKVKMV